MALIYADRVKETTTTTGTGTYTLAGAAAGFQSFDDALADGDTCHYCATDDTDWEVGLGTFTASGTTLARTAIFASSNSGNAVNWSAGTRDIFLTIPAKRTTLLDDPVFHPGLTSGGWYAGVNVTNSISTAFVANANTLYFCPILVPSRTSLDRLAILVQGGFTGSAGSVARLGIYTANAGVAHELVLDAGTVAIDVAGNREITISQVLDPGWYWTCFVHNSTGTIRINAASNSAFSGFYPQTGTSSLNANSLTKSFTFGALTTPLSGSFTYGTAVNQPLIWTRIV